MKKILKPIIIIIIILIIVVVTVFYSKKKAYESISTKKYYMKFMGGVGEQIYTTYLFWEGGQKASYVCSTRTTKSWGSPEWKEKITKKGNLTYMQEIYEVAKNNSSYSYAIINKDIFIPECNIQYQIGDTLTIEQVHELFNIIRNKIISIYEMPPNF